MFRHVTNSHYQTILPKTKERKFSKRQKGTNKEKSYRLKLS